MKSAGTNSCGRPAVSESDSGEILRGEVMHPQHDASLELLVNELQHRIRNLFSVIQSVVINTEAHTADGYRAALSARIAALSDAYSLIESARDRRISLAKLLEQTLKPHALPSMDRIVLSGPDVALDPQVALSLHMVFHELATNASKHGALTAASGSVEVLWDIVLESGNKTLGIRWRERGGPEVIKPQHEGFGTRLIVRALAGARVDMDFGSAGLVFRLLLDIDPPAVLRGENC
jgi:two-component sensor histidine kinase